MNNVGEKKQRKGESQSILMIFRITREMCQGGVMDETVENYSQKSLHSKEFSQTLPFY